MNNALKIFTALALSIAVEFPASAQTMDDSLFVTQVSQKNISSLLNLQKTGGPLYNGEIHYPHPKFKNGGHASFINSNYTKGTIVYDGLMYKSMSVMYDLVRDQLLLLNADSSGGIVVQSEHVDRFSLHNHNFINIKSGTVPKNIAPGYYDLLYDGRITLLARRIKKVTENVTQYIEKEVEQTVSYYLLKDSVYTRIKGKQDLVTLLKATKNENQDYIKANKLDFNGNREEAFLRLVSFHDSLKQ